MRRQGGAVGIAQLREAGFTDEAVKGLVARGLVARRHRGVYVDALAPLAVRGHLFAALLACHETAFLSHRTAAALHGLRALNVRAIEVTVVAEHTPRHKGLIVHRTSRTPLPDEIRSFDGLRIASPSRTLVDLGARENTRELARLIAETARRKQLDLTRIEASIAHRPRAAGIEKLQEALQRYRPPDPDAKSNLERDFAQWLTTHPEIPAPQRNVWLEDHWELDFFWPEHQLVVETDGEPYHLTPDELERDRIKDAYLQRQNIRVIRVTGFRFEHDRSGIINDLRALTNQTRAA
jgi:very-short-patch-repair endonuclease